MIYRSGPAPRFSSGRNGIRMLTVSSPLTGKELAKFANLLAVTSREILPLPIQG